MAEINIKVDVELSDIWDEITDEQFADELEDRWGNPEVQAAVRELRKARPQPQTYEEDEDPLLEPLSDWDRGELLKAIREDDGRRALELLRRFSPAA